MSQERLAEILGISFQQVQRYESGKNRISVERIQEMAAALGVTVTYFFADDSAPPVVSEELERYFPTGDEKTLLKYFRRVSSKGDRQFVITAARLAGKKKP